MKKLLSLLIATSLSLGACSSAASGPSFINIATVASTNTAVPSPTPEPPTASPNDLVNLVGSGEPDEEWNGIPIMPEAIHGVGLLDDGYMFTVAVPAEEIRDFYIAELEGQGMSLAVTGVRVDENRVFLPFSAGKSNVFSIVITSADDVNVVRINKY